MRMFLEISKMKICITAFMAFITVFSYAQDDPQFSMNMHNQLMINPGYAGSGDAICAKLLSRNQYMGFEGNPKTTVFNADMPLTILGAKSGIGMTFFQDQIGMSEKFNFKLAYSYKMEVGGGTLSLGTNLGVMSNSLETPDGEWQAPSDLSGRRIVDPLKPTGEGHIGFDMGLGAFYKGKANGTNDYYVGLSVTHLTGPKIKYGETAETFQKQNIYLTAGYDYQLLNPLLMLRPSVFIKTDLVATQYDVNILAIYNKMFWGGVSYRVADAVVVMAGLEMDNGLKLGIAYDFTTSEMRNASSGSVEVMLGYCFKIQKRAKKGIYKSVRFLN